MISFSGLIFGIAVLGRYCECNPSDDASAIRNRGRVLARTAGYLSEQLPDQWPGKTNGNIICPTETNLLRGVPKKEKHLAAINVLHQYTNHLLSIYSTTQTMAATLYKCTSNKRIGETLTKMREEDLNWPENKNYHATLSSEVVATMNARLIFKKVKSFGECLGKTKKVGSFYRCVKKISKGCGKNKNSKDRGQKKGKVRKGGKSEKDGRNAKKSRRRNEQGRKKSRKQRQ